MLIITEPSVYIKIAIIWSITVKYDNTFFKDPHATSINSTFDFRKTPLTFSFLNQQEPPDSEAFIPIRIYINLS